MIATTSRRMPVGTWIAAALLALVALLGAGPGIANAAATTPAQPGWVDVTDAPSGVTVALPGEHAEVDELPPDPRRVVERVQAVEDGRQLAFAHDAACFDLCSNVLQSEQLLRTAHRPARDAAALVDEPVEDARPLLQRPRRVGGDVAQDRSVVVMSSAAWHGSSVRHRVRPQS